MGDYKKSLGYSTIGDKMKLITAILLFASTAWAGPFLVCDPQESVTYYGIYKDAVLVEPNQPIEPDGSFKYDLVDAGAGTSAWTAVACNERGCSDVSNPYQLPALAGTPLNLRLEP